MVWPGRAMLLASKEGGLVYLENFPHPFVTKAFRYNGTSVDLRSFHKNTETNRNLDLVWFGVSCGITFPASTPPEIKGSFIPPGEGVRWNEVHGLVPKTIETRLKWRAAGYMMDVTCLSKSQCLIGCRRGVMELLCNLVLPPTSLGSCWYFHWYLWFVSPDLRPQPLFKPRQPLSCASLHLVCSCPSWPGIRILCT